MQIFLDCKREEKLRLKQVAGYLIFVTVNNGIDGLKIDNLKTNRVKIFQLKNSTSFTHIGEKLCVKGKDGKYLL